MRRLVEARFDRVPVGRKFRLLRSRMTRKFPTATFEVRYKKVERRRAVVTTKKSIFFGDVLTIPPSATVFFYELTTKPRGKYKK